MTVSFETNQAGSTAGATQTSWNITDRRAQVAIYNSLQINSAPGYSIAWFRHVRDCGLGK